MFDAAGAKGPRHLWSRLQRKRAEHWISSLVCQVRAGEPVLPEGAPAHAVAMHRDQSGGLLPPRIAAVEILNLLRPTVAISVYVVLVAHALHQHPEARRALEEGDARDLERFIQEVRRFYPFFPAVLARVRETFMWNDYQFPKSTRVLLDLHGTNRHSPTWRNPGEFQPDRFRDWDGSAFNFVPQGGGDHHLGHRCPGEWITIELMKLAVDFLVHKLHWKVPSQDLTIDRSRMPALPKSQMILSDVEWLNQGSRSSTTSG